MRSDAADSRIRWPVAVGFLLTHIACLGAFWFTTTSAVVLCIVLVVVTQGLGISLGYHRYLTHRCFSAGRKTRGFLVLCGVLAMQGGPLLWRKNHVAHHREPDGPNDPHSPLAGFLDSQFIWFLRRRDSRPEPAPQFGRAVAWIEGRYWTINGLFLCILACAGLALGGWHQMFSWLTWGGAIRLTYVWHTTFLVNSLGHSRIGLFRPYRNHATDDNSHNCIFLSLLSFGEGLHNNHHARPGSACFAHRRGEADLGYWLLAALSRVGVVRLSRRGGS